MKTNRILFKIIALLSLLFLSSCARVLQEMVVREDGSGTIRFAVGVDSQAYDQFQLAIPDGFELENLLANLILDENVSNVQQETYLADGRTWDSIQFEVTSFSALFEEERRFGPLILSLEEDEGVYRFEQLIDLNVSNVSIPGVNLLDLSGAGYTVQLFAPQIIDTNGVQQAGGTANWTVPLRDLLQGGESIFLQAEYVLEPYEGVYIPWDVFFPYVVVGFLTLGVLSILVVIWVNTRSKGEEEQKLTF